MGVPHDPNSDKWIGNVAIYRGTDKGTDKGTDILARGTDKGTDKGTDQGTDKGTDNGTVILARGPIRDR